MGVAIYIAKPARDSPITALIRNHFCGVKTTHSAGKALPTLYPIPTLYTLEQQHIITHRKTVAMPAGHTATESAVKYTETQ